MKQYIVDAFADKVFHGNQAAVCILEEWPEESLMMDITRENNFSETAFTVKACFSSYFVELRFAEGEQIARI